MKKSFFSLTDGSHSGIVSLCTVAQWSGSDSHISLVIPQVAAHLLASISRCLCRTADKCFPIHLWWHKISVISSLFKTSAIILCPELRGQESRVFGLTFMWSWSALAANFSLCCRALLILSGKLEHKSGKSSFILMSQVLDLLKSEYWNWLELGTFKGLRIRSACGADLVWGNEFPPQDPALVWHSCFSFFFFFLNLLYLQSHFCWILHAAWQEFYANASSKEGRWQGTGIHPTDILYR